MALTQTQVSELYVAIFNRASEGNGNTFWQGQADAASAATAMLATTDAAAYFGTSLDTDQAFIEHIYLNTFNKTPADDAAGIAFWVGQLATESRGSVVAGIVAAATDAANAGAAQDQFNNRVATSNYTASQLASAPSDYATSLAFDGGLTVTNVASTVTSAQSAVDVLVANSGGGSGTAGSTYYLTEKQDMLTGTADDDVFIARGNSSLDNADILDGGAGRDTVEVMLDNLETAESPLFTNIEVLKVQAQQPLDINGNNNIDENGENDVDASGYNSNIDAGDMRSVEEYWSEDSRAHVTIEDVSRNSHITTVGFRESDPGAGVDLNVFFDPENITAKGVADTGSTLLIKVANVFNIAEGANPLEGFARVTFNVGGTDIETTFGGLTSYADLVTAIDAAIVAAGFSGVSVTAQSSQNAFFSIDIAKPGGGTYTAGTLAGQYSPILLSSASHTITNGAFILDDEQGSGNMVQTQTDVQNSPVPALTSVNVIVDRVGKDSDGGDLLIGSDSTGASGSAGIQQFFVDVDRDSNVRTMASTNNSLEVVNVKNISDNNASGDGNLKTAVSDVRVFDASTMKGDVALTASLSGNVVAKYLELTDEANPTADNSQTQAYRDVVDTEFSYDLGAGDDTLALSISSDNAAASGTGSREDFVLEINAGAGDDVVNTVISKNAVNADNWYINQKAQGNLTVNTDAGNDTVNSRGAGDWAINTGSGDDTVYANNEDLDTEAATWAIANAAGIALNDLQATGSAAAAFLYKSSITVTFSGAQTAGSSGVTGAAAAAANLNGFEKTIQLNTVNGVGNQLDINQAIKTAINSDAVLSKLLIAKDGPADTLVITSLVDGQYAVDDLNIQLGALDITTLSAAELSSTQDSYRAFVNDSTAVLTQAVLNTGTDVYASPAVVGGVGLDNIDSFQFAQTGGAADIDGFATSDSVSDNVINLGSGNDVAVLGTDGNSNDTIVLSASFGTDTIFNFVDANADAAQDFIDVTAYLGGVETLPGGSTSTVSQTVIATGNNAGSFAGANAIEANDVFIINDFAQAATETWAGLTGASLLAAINSTTNVAAANDYANISAADFTVGDTNANLVGTTLKSVFFVENDLNDGEYKVFEVTATGGATDEFTSVSLMGVIDFGDTLTNVTSTFI